MAARVRDHRSSNLPVAAATGINADFGQNPTVRTILGILIYGALDASPVVVTDASAPKLTADRVGTVTIAATVSGFAARQAVVSLPPAALVVHPATLDACANAHGGLAPIVVVPDLLGDPDNNPVRVGSALGNSATYVTVDVPNWIRSTFAVDASPTG